MPSAVPAPQKSAEIVREKATAEKEQKKDKRRKLAWRGWWQQRSLSSLWQTHLILEGHSVSRCHMALHQVYENEDSPLINQSEERSIIKRFCRGTSYKNSIDFIQLPSCRMWDLLVASGKAPLSQNPLMLFSRSEKDTLMYADWGRYFSPSGGLFMKMSHSVVNKATSVNRLRLPYSSGPQQRDLHNLHLTDHHLQIFVTSS